MHAIIFDIKATQKERDIENKLLWKQNWISIMQDTLGTKGEDFFINNEKELYQFIKEEMVQTPNDYWLILIIMELLCFELYHPLSGNSEDNKTYRGLKPYCNYIKDVFCEKQMLVDYAYVESIDKMYKKYGNIITESMKNTAMRASVVLAISAATAGMAWTFAPQIAVFLTGGTFTSLSGAALTSASLAAIGGGSLLTGGLGMAGGTAIITGGGALLGAIGYGSLSATSIMLFSSSGCVLHECVKLLTFCKFVLIEKNSDKNIVKGFHERIEKGVLELQGGINALEKQALDKEKKKMVKSAKDDLKYLERCSEELAKMCK